MAEEHYEETEENTAQSSSPENESAIHASHSSSSPDDSNLGDAGFPAAQASAESSQEEPPSLSDLDEALLKVADLEEQLARRNADIYNLQQEYSGYVRRSKAEALNQFELGKNKVLESLIPVLDNAALAREHEELHGPAGKVVEELENTLNTNFKLERFGTAGDPFDPEMHEALMHSTSADVQTEQVQMIMQPGYRVGDKIIRPARVGVVSPE